MIARFGLEDEKDARYVDMSMVGTIRGLHVHRDEDNDLVASIYLVMKDHKTEFTLERVMFKAEYRDTNVKQSIFLGGGFKKELIKIDRDVWESCPRYLEMREHLDYLLNKWDASL